MACVLLLMMLRAKRLKIEVFYSVGGGFIVDHAAASQDKHLGEDAHKLPFPFKTAEELLAHLPQTEYDD